jgi:hypothetical protein
MNDSSPKGGDEASPIFELQASLQATILANNFHRLAHAMFTRVVWLADF